MTAEKVKLERLASLFYLLFFRFQSRTRNEKDGPIFVLPRRFSAGYIKSFQKDVDEFVQNLMYDTDELLTSDEERILRDRSSGYVKRIFEFLQTASQELDRQKADCRREFLDVSSDSGIPEGIRSSFYNSTESYTSFATEIAGSSVSFIVEDNIAFTSRLIMDDVHYLQNSLIGDYLTKGIEARKTPEGYLFKMVQEDCMDNREVITEFICSGMRHDLTLWNYESGFRTWDNQFIRSRIRNAAASISLKYDLLGIEYLNQKELALLPAAAWLSKVEDSAATFLGYRLNNRMDGLPDEGEDYLLALAREADCPAMVPVIKAFKDSTGQYGKAQRVNAWKIALQKASNEQFARLLIRKFHECTDGFADKFEESTPAPRLNQIKEIINGVMTEYGYQGTFPHFSRIAEFNKMRVLMHYEFPAIVGNEKNVTAMVDCVPSDEYFGIGIDFICSTIIHSKNELDKAVPVTVESGFFNDYPRCRRYGRVVSYNAYSTADSQDLYEDIERTLPAIAVIAAKTAIKEKLNSEEKKLRTFTELPLWYISLLWILAGLFFGVFMALGFMLITFIFGILFTLNFREAITAVQDLSGFMMLICLAGGGAFGVLMWLITVLAARKGL
ncbi:MAG: tripartite tricarboxylate transporter TctB family protein [Saccharofermentanales bacterium]